MEVVVTDRFHCTQSRASIMTRLQPTLMQMVQNDIVKWYDVMRYDVLYDTARATAMMMHNKNSNDAARC